MTYRSPGTCTGNEQPQCDSWMSFQMNYEYNEELDKDVMEATIKTNFDKLKTPTY